MNVTSSLSGNYHVCDVPALVVEKNTNFTTINFELWFDGVRYSNDPLTYVNGLITQELSNTWVIFLLKWIGKAEGQNYSFNIKLTEGSQIIELPFVVYFPVMVIQGPINNGLYFQKSVPDIILERNDQEPYVNFELKKGNDVILSENYLFSADHKLRIRNIYEIIEMYFSSDSEISEPGTTNIASALALDFTIKITSPITHLFNFTVLKCDANLPFPAGTWTQNNFLTRKYLEKRTAITRNEYLSFLLKPEYGATALKYTIYYELGGQQIMGNLSETAAPTQPYSVATFNCSLYRILKHANLPNYTKVFQYDIWITGTGLETSKYTFMVDNVDYRNTKSFVFTNCFGVLESFTATGTSEVSKNVEYNLANIENHYRKITQNFYAEKNCNSGFLWETETDWLDDFIRSYNVLQYSQDIELNEEITLVSVDKIDSEANTLQWFKFSYRKANNLHLTFANAAKNISQFMFDSTFE